MAQSGRILSRLLGLLLITCMPLIRNVVKPLAKSVLLPLELTAASETDAVIHKKMFGSGTKTSVFSNEDLNGIMKDNKSLKELGLLTKGVSKTIKKEAKEQRGGFLSILLGTLGASLLGNMLTGK